MEDTLRQVVKKMARNELEKLKNEKNPKMHKMFILEMERGLLPAVMDQTDDNQSKAAQWLGIKVRFARGGKHYLISRSGDNLT